MGEGSKVRVKTMPQHCPVVADLIRNPEGRRADRPVTLTQTVMLASRQYPQHETPNPTAYMMGSPQSRVWRRSLCIIMIVLFYGNQRTVLK